MWTLFLLTMLGATELTTLESRKACMHVAQESVYLPMMSPAIGMLCLAPAPEATTEEVPA